MEIHQMIESFINKASEGSYWDFKQNWHCNNADLLKDIICMANNTTDDMQDGYIIFGIDDKTYDIIGVSGDSNRKNQENIIGFLSSQSWAGEEIPNVDVKTIKIVGKEVDVLIVYNKEVTPYYLLQDYSKTTNSGKNKKVVSTGVIYSRVGDRNTSSAECATKRANEFLWKKRFGLVGSDTYKVIKRLQNTDNWYSLDEYNTIYNREYDDICIKRDSQYKLTVEIDDGKADTATWVMDFPYLFTSILNWNIGRNETGRRANWDIFINGRKLDFSLYGVQGTKQDYYHIEPETKFESGFGITLDKCTNGIKYYFYLQNSVNLLAYKLFFSMQCYHEDQKVLNRAFSVIPVFECENEHVEFIDYVKNNIKNFILNVNKMNIDEMHPAYSQAVNTAIVYKLGKTLVQWLKRWRLQR